MRGIFLILLIPCLVACSASLSPMSFRDPNLSVVWPAPPEKARIRYLAQINGPDDILPPQGNVDRLFTLITGEKAALMPLVTPMGIASDGRRFVYVADGAARLVHCFDLGRQEVSYLQFAGTSPLKSPTSVAVAADGSVYVADSVLARVFKYSQANGYLGELQGATFQRPAGIAVTADHEKIVIDVLAHRLLIFDRNDRFVRSFPQPADDVALNRPTHVAVDRNKNVYVTDAMNFRVTIFDWEGRLLTTIGEPGDTPGYFSRPKGIGVDSDGHIYVVDALQGNVQIYDRSGQLLLPFGGTGKRGGEFNLPSGIFIDDSDRIYVADTYNRRVQVFQYLKGSTQ